MSTYTIKPLEWKYLGTNGYQGWRSTTIWGDIRVERACPSTEWTPWWFYFKRISGSSCYNDAKIVDDADDGKAKAEQWYINMLMPALQPTTNAAQPQKGK